ncbi:hypothetical protein [Nitratireductor pacificus]|uniref:hypothetical protein n=1 Tax=Nitratireductor pacificus TaxID=1231180 RepID=UPI0002DC4C7E|nr:hypothetical protein [Nitratireductor pacificus]
MAVILNFVPRPRRAPTGSSSQRRSGASVIIFPGVRYERRDEPLKDDGGDDHPRDTRRLSKS